MHKIGQLTHFDLDGCGCHIILDRAVGVDTWYTAGYSKIEDWIRAGKYYELDELYVTDLCLGQELIDILANHFGSNLHIFDHHPESEGMFATNNANLHYSDKYSGTRMLYDHFFKDSSPRMKRLIYAIDTYDLWKTDSKYWKLGHALNEMFWHMNTWNFANRFKFGFAGFTGSERMELARIYKEKSTTIKKLEENRFVIKDKIVAVVPVDMAVVNDLGLAWKDQEYFLCVRNEKGHFEMSARSNVEDCVDVGNILAGLVVDYPGDIASGGGHQGSGGLSFKDHVDMAHVIDFLELIGEKIDKERNE